MIKPTEQPKINIVNPNAIVLISTAFIFLKLDNHFPYSWWWVFCPQWLSVSWLLLVQIPWYTFMFHRKAKMAALAEIIEAAKKKKEENPIQDRWDERLKSAKDTWDNK
jgi:hypothetical protein